MTPMEAVRRNVVYKRAERGISQADLATKAGIARQSVSKIESGSAGTNVTVETLEKIARVLGCNVGQLFEFRPARVDDEELLRRAKAPRSEFVGAHRLLDAIDEANEIRYSRAGRPKAVGGKTSSRGR